MKTMLGRSLLRLRRFLGAMLAAILIAAAVAMALGQLLLPLLHKHPQQVAELLAWRLQRPVSVSAVHAEWQPSGPLLAVTGLAIGAGEERLQLPSAQLKVDFGAWLKSSRHLLELRVSGVELTLRHEPDEHWRMIGLSGNEQRVDQPGDIDLPVDLLLSDASVIVDDVANNRRLRLEVRALRAVREDGVLRLGARLLREGAQHPIDLVAHIGAKPGAARVYVAGEDLDLHQWAAGLGGDYPSVDRGHGDLELWLRWKDGSFAGFDATLDVADAQLSSAQHGTLSIPDWRGNIQMQRKGGGWQLGFVRQRALSEASPGVASVWWREGRGEGVDVIVDARDLEIARVSRWAAWLPQIPDMLRRWARQASPTGVIDSLHLQWEGPSQFSVDATVSDVGLAATAHSPAIDAIDLRVYGDADALLLELPAQALSVNFPGLFAQPFVLGFVQGTVAAWQQQDGAWQLHSDHLRVQGQGFATVLRGGVIVGGKHASPLLDLAALVLHAEVPAAKLFWPLNVMPDAARDWLDRALVAGELKGARALLRGHLDDWPFVDGRGRFEAVANVRDATLRYAPDWPPATGIRAQVQFVNTGMAARADAGAVLDNRAGDVRAQIADFHEPVLQLAVKGHGTGSSLHTLLQRSPIGARFGKVLDDLQFGGRAEVAFTLVDPMQRGVEDDLRLNGEVKLQDVDFAAPAWSLHLDDLNGPLQFSAGGFRSNVLTAQFNGTPTRLAVRAGTGTADAQQAFEAEMHGRFDAVTLVADYPTLQPLVEISSGAADFDIGIEVNAAREASLHIESDLRGMALQLPAPLAKAPGVVLPLRVQSQLPFAGQVVAVSLGTVLDAKLRMPSATEPLAMDVALGPSADALLEGAGISLHGRVERLDLSSWLGQWAGLERGGHGASEGLREAEIEIGSMAVFGRSFSELRLQLQRTDDAYSVQISGEPLSGSISIPIEQLAQRGITARLDRLYWPAADASDEQAATTGVAPSAVPPLHLWVRDLRLGPARLGDARFESYPIANGLRVEQLQTRSEAVQINARGTWNGDASANRTHLVIELSSADLGRMLDAFGYDGLVAGGTTLAHIDGSWPGPPSAFSLADMEGVMKVHVEDGRILDVEPGVGRLFGLFSLRELPRRLSLDFGDLFQSGFSFNSIDGSFVFTDGSARTDDLVITGPAATIRIRGLTGLRSKTYDQYVDVVPRVGGALPVVGAIAGGPVGAAAGLAVQTLLGRGLNEAAAASYHVSGAWAEPEITRLAPDRAQPAPAVSVPQTPEATSAETPAGAPDTQVLSRK